MALRAGYYGIKRALLRKLEALTNAVVIKSIGEGLELSAAGELSNTSTGGVDYSTTLIDTGKKWIDGKTIKAIVLDYHASPVIIKYDTWGSILDNVSVALGVIPEVLLLCTAIGTSGGVTPCICYYDNNTDKLNATTPRNGNNSEGSYIILEFTEATVTAAKTRKSTKSTAKADTVKEGE